MGDASTEWKPGKPAQQAPCLACDRGYYLTVRGFVVKECAVCAAGGVKTKDQHDLDAAFHREWLRGLGGGHV